MNTVPFAPSVAQEVVTLLVPTPGIEECRYYHLVQKLLELRIRSIMTGVNFEDCSKSLIQMFITTPPHYTTAKKVAEFIESEAKELSAAFKLFEQNKYVQDAFNTLVPYKGMMFQIANTTLTGIQLIIDLRKD